MVTLNATRQGGTGALKSTITYTPTAKEIEEYLLSIKGASALSATVESLIGAGVVWELDVINRRVSYTEAL